MSPYWIGWGILCVVVFKDAATSIDSRSTRWEFGILFIAMTLFLMLRYGQGSDYFGYYYNYLMVSNTEITFPSYDVHGELGYLLICNIFRVLHIPYTIFVVLISVVQMGGLLLFLRRYGVNTPFALLLSVPSLYFVYFMSGLRQGIVIAVLLGVLLPLLEDKRYISYIIGTALCMTIHSVAFIFLLLPVAQWIKKVSTLQILTMLAWVGGILLATPIGQTIFSAIELGSLQFYLGNTHISIAAVAERLFFLTVVTYLYQKIEKVSMTGIEQYRFVYRCYLVAMAVYGLLCWNDLVASRTAGALRYVEIYLVVAGVRRIDRFGRYLVMLFFTVLSSMMLVKNVNAAISEGAYNSNIKVFNYPYVSLIDRSAIYELRDVYRAYQREIERDLYEQARA